MLVYVLGLWAGAAGTVSAQGISPNPEINVACSPASIPVEVYPGATRVGTTFCTATNSGTWRTTTNSHTTTSFRITF